MPQIRKIATDSEYELALERVRQIMDCGEDADEVAELKELAKAVQEYEEQHCPFLNVQTDGVDDIISRLDLGMMQLEDVLRVFGGPNRFFEYMTRQRDLDAATLEALVIEFDMERDQLEKPFRARPGGQDISPELVQEPCEDPVCCPPDHVDWRVELAESMREPTGIGRIQAGYPAYPC